MRCVYCDTEYAFKGGKNMSLDDIMAQVASYGARYVCVTGGEPLAQKKGCLELLQRLCDAGYEVSLETGGAVSTTGVDERVAVILDVKTPGSGELEKNHWDNLSRLKPNDEIKLVLCGREDYEWARHLLNEHALTEKCPVIFSPVYSQLKPADLADWVLEDKLPVRMQVQLHKILWGETPGK